MIKPVPETGSKSDGTDSGSSMLDLVPQIPPVDRSEVTYSREIVLEK